MLPSKAVVRYCQLATAIINNHNSELYSNVRRAVRSLLASTFYLRSEEVAISAANYNYNHYSLPFSHVMIIVITSDEDMLEKQPAVRRYSAKDVILKISKKSQKIPRLDSLFNKFAGF